MLRNTWDVQFMQQKIFVAVIRFTFVKKVYHINVILLPLFHILPQR